MKEYLLLIILILSLLLVKFLRKEAVFVPLSAETIKKALKLAKIRRSDILYDLGSGDGRIAVEASRLYGIKSVGIEKNTLLYWLSKIKSRKFKDRVKVIHGDFLKQNISKATVATVYLTQKLNDMLEPKLKKELRKGTRVISADHTFKNMKEIKKLKAGHLYLHLYKL